MNNPQIRNEIVDELRNINKTLKTIASILERSEEIKLDINSLDLNPTEIANQIGKKLSQTFPKL